MDNTANQVLWHQGSVLSRDALAEINLNIQPESPACAVVISHDCDIANNKEDFVEVIISEEIVKPDGNYSYAKNPRQLHLSYKRDNKEIYIQLVAWNKRNVRKSELFSYQPDGSTILNNEDIQILQKWLAARYRRAAFPNAFEKHLREKVFENNASVQDKIKKAMANDTGLVLSILFDLDDGQNIERDQRKDIYQLRIFVLCKSDTCSETLASDMANNIEKIFREAFCKNSEWKKIQVLCCEAIEDTVMTVKEERNLKQWSPSFIGD